MAPRLIHRADDAALSLGTNLAIRDVVLSGAVRNVGLMANGPALAHAAEIFLPLAERVCFGVHAVLNSEFVEPRVKPVCAAEELPGLVQEDGTFFPAVTDWAGRASLAAIEREIRSQIAVLRRAGFSPAYLDTHMVFDWVEGCEALLRAICASEGLVWGDGFPKLRKGTEPDRSAQALVRVLHPAYPDEACPRLVLCATNEDVLPKRRQEAEDLLSNAGSLSTAGRFSDLVPQGVAAPTV